MKEKIEKIDKFDRLAYKPPKTHTRFGSMTVLAAPSRIHNTLFYVDGTTKNENPASKNGNGNTRTSN